MAEPDTQPVTDIADDAKIVAAAHEYAAAQADYAAQKEACDTATAEYEAERDAAHAELAKASEEMAAKQAALLAASTGHPVNVEKAKAQKEVVKKRKGKK